MRIKHRYSPRQWLRHAGVFAAMTLATSVVAAPVQAPEFRNIEHWINTPPLSLQALHGKVVLIDFWGPSQTPRATPSPI